MSADMKFMERAIELARKGSGRTSPNPIVGVVIVKRGKIIGEGWHKRAGGDHAEVSAIKACKGGAKGGVLYVTLEPCNHTGKTPPCTEAIIEAGIKEVFIGARDRSPKKGWRGAVKLKRAGIKVTAGLMKSECEKLVEDFHKYSATGYPFVTLKTAITLDGKVSTVTGDSKWISSDVSRKYVHKMRNEMDAVMVGIDTVTADDPMLTVRHGRQRNNPVRVIVDGKLKISSSSNLVKTAKDVPTVIATTKQVEVSKIKKLEKLGVKILVCPKGGVRVNLHWLMKELGSIGIMSVLLEGAGNLSGAVLKAGLIDRVMFFIAPKIIGGDKSAVTSVSVAKMADAWNLTDVNVWQSGSDVVVEGRVD